MVHDLVPGMAQMTVQMMVQEGSNGWLSLDGSDESSEDEDSDGSV